MRFLGVGLGFRYLPPDFCAYMVLELVLGGFGGVFACCVAMFVLLFVFR